MEALTSTKIRSFKHGPVFLGGGGGGGGIYHGTLRYVPGTAITISLSLLQDGQSSLMLASKKGHVKVVEMLLLKGAQVDLQDKVSMGGMERGWGDHMGGMERGWGDHMGEMERGGVTIWEGWRGGGVTIWEGWRGGGVTLW